MTLEICLLGPLRVVVDGRVVTLPAGRLPALLAVLALSPGVPVSVDRLASAVWGEESAVDVRTNLQTSVSRLRRLLGGELIETRDGGYALLAEPDQVDAVRFVRLLDRAATASDQAAEHDDLVAALRLWRGMPFANIWSEWLEQTQATRLQERYLAALERRVDLEVPRTTDLTVTLAELTELTGRHPLRESLWVRLLIVLERLGRPAEALERYAMMRARLADELGTEPGPELRRVHAALLAGRSPAGPTRAARRVVPRQLPADTEVFAGRASALAELDRLLERRSGTVVCAVTGAPGIGKSTLALHWAHQVAHHFPGGQLYVNLRGFDPSGTPLAPADALRGFLDALDVPPQAVPAGPQAQAGLYRSMLAGTRTLVLLDNARDAGQVVPLLPGAPGCLVLVTSRNRLPGLVTAGARPLGLDPLGEGEAEHLLIRRLGEQRVRAERSAARELVGKAAGLPLALAIVAARAATNPRFSLASVAAQLGGLDGFDGGDPASSARTVFSWSCHGLGEPAARLFRLLGLHPGPDITPGAAAAVAGLPAARVRPLLAELTRAHLINEHVPGRYAFHDLLRAFAREQAGEHEPAEERRAAIRRTLDHYVHTAHRADHLLFQHGETIALPAPAPGVQAEDLGDADEAVAWFGAERHVLLAAIGQAATHGFDREVCHLAWTLDVFLHRQGHWHSRNTAQHAALDAARRLGETTTLSRAHRHLGSSYTDLGHHDEAHLHLRQALELAADAGDTAGQAWTHYYRDLLYGLQGGHDHEALAAAQDALRLFTQIQHEYGQAIALTDVGWYQGRLGDHGQALESCEQALTMHQRLGNLAYQAHTWSCLGEIHQDRGDRAKALDCRQRALDLFVRLRDRYGEASTLADIGDLHQAGGDLAAARRSWQDAHAILSELDPPAAARILERLHASRPV
ncbi:BTAD domain-containing putative transcriptional regulator [Nonomuraea sp. NPDC050790]|uniref:AfsR/SARP family transcriptional regulator n=1 Tax=Nonomuraea sp. NPDC050790 TaxID=3364371 RepID=UPI0037ADDE9E